MQERQEININIVLGLAIEIPELRWVTALLPC